MKVCEQCGEGYANWIDFCFQDGGVLTEKPVDLTGGSFDAPLPRSMTNSQVDDPFDAPMPSALQRKPPAPTLPPYRITESDDEIPNRPAGTGVSAIPDTAHPDAVIPDVPDEPQELPASDLFNADTLVPGGGDRTPMPAEPRRPMPSAVPPPEVEPEPVEVSFEDTDEDFPDDDDDGVAVYVDVPINTGSVAKKAAPLGLVAIAGILIILLMIVGGLGFVAVAVMGTSEDGPQVPATVAPAPVPLVAPTAEVQPEPEPAAEPTEDPDEVDNDAGEGPGPDSEAVDEGEPASVQAEREPEAPVPSPSLPVAPMAAPPPAPEPTPAPAAEPDNPWGVAPAAPTLPAPAPVPAPEVRPPPQPAPAAGPAKSGPVMVFFSGRVGDTLIVDGSVVGVIPVKFNLTEGEHAFAVEGDAGRFTVTRSVTVVEGKTTMMHLDR
jgi:hypothetical protein